MRIQEIYQKNPRPILVAGISVGGVTALNTAHNRRR